MTAVTLRPLSASEMKSGSAIGIGCTLPCVMSSLSTAPAGRGESTANALAPRISRRRLSGKGKLNWNLGISIQELIRPVHIFGIEGKFNFFPAFLVLRLDHIERLAGQYRAYRAVARGHCGDGAAVHTRQRRGAPPAIRRG